MTPEPPPPGTATEMYLAAILDELKAIRGRLPETSTVPDTPPPGTVELTEPAPPRKPAPRRQQARRKPS